MKKHIAVLSVSALAIAGCDNYKGEFEQAIAQDLEANGSLCLGIKKWPVDVTILEIKSKSLRALTFANLDRVGLLNGEDTAIKTMGWKMPVARYTPNEKLRPFMVGPDICWGKKVLAEVVKWDGPMSNGDYKEAVVTYNYGVITAPWLAESNLPLYYPEMLQANAGAQSAQLTLKLTSAGWEVK
ncbi:hypothetical protein D9M71_554760 [compost metagenome]